MSLEQLRAFLGWGAILNLVFLSFVFFFFLAARDLMYRLHGRWFGLSKETLSAILYGMMAWFKLATFLFFIIPYVVLRFFM